MASIVSCVPVSQMCSSESVVYKNVHCFCMSPTGLNYLNTSYVIPSHLEEIAIVLRSGCYFLSRTYGKVRDSPLHAPGRPCVSLILSQGFKSEFLRLFLREDKCGFSPAPAAWSCHLCLGHTLHCTRLTVGVW